MNKSTPEAIRMALNNIQIESGRDVSDVLAYIEELEFKAVKLEEELRKMRISTARKPASASSMNSRLKDALRE